VKTISVKAIAKLGQIVSAHALRDDDDITLITREGMALRTRATSIRLVGRATQGVRIIRMAKGDQVVSVAVVEGSPEIDEVTENVEGENGHHPDEALDLVDEVDEIDEELDTDIDAEADDVDVELLADENGEIIDEDWEEDDTAEA
jgi:DNA gyrase subunit A